MAFALPEKPPSVNAPNPAPAPVPQQQPVNLSNPSGSPGGLPAAAATDPGLSAAAALAARMKAQADAALRAQRSQALINFGDPSLLKGLGFAVDPSVLAAAKANQYSFVNMLHQSDADRTRQFMNSLAARGILHSGETGYQTGQESKWYGQNLYGAEQALLANLGGYLQNYLGQVNNADANYGNALSTWWTNYLNNPDAYPAPPIAAGEQGGGGSAVPAWWESGWGNYASRT
jgi:hypothetical protein